MIFFFLKLTTKTQYFAPLKTYPFLIYYLQCNEKRVAKLSADMLTLLCDHVDKLLDFHPDLPKRIVEVIGLHLVFNVKE